MAVALYFVSSIICALSSSMAMLIASRTLQGVSGGGLGSLIFIVISDLFSMRFAFHTLALIFASLMSLAGLDLSFSAFFK